MSNSNPLMLGYLMHYPLTRFWQQFYFSRVVRLTAAPIPQQDACLVTPNHQNAFVDAYTVAPLYDDQMRFMTRADVFKNPVAAKFIQSHGLTPIYRERDGRDSLEKNDEVFDGTNRLLAQNGKILIFPEANCVVEKRIRPIKKGTARMAFLALENMRQDQKLWLIPTGIWYGRHTQFRTHVLVKSGVPIDVRAVRDEAGTDAKALLKLTRMVEAELKALNMSYPEGLDAERLDTFFELATSANCIRPSFFNRDVTGWFAFQEKLNEKLSSLQEAQLRELEEKVHSYEKNRDAAGLSDFAFDRPVRKATGFLIQAALVPLAVAGTWFIQPALGLGKVLRQRFGKEKQFITSVSFVGGMFGSYYWWLGNAVASGVIFGWQYFFFAGLAGPLLSWLELHRRDHARTLFEQVKLHRLLKKNNGPANEALAARNHLVRFAESLLKPANNR